MSTIFYWTVEVFEWNNLYYVGYQVVNNINVYYEFYPNQNAKKTVCFITWFSFLPPSLFVI